jgi:hypothetical protein
LGPVGSISTAGPAGTFRERRSPTGPAGSYGAEDGTRTRDPNLGKVVLYQLSHFRAQTVV